MAEKATPEIIEFTYYGIPFEMVDGIVRAKEIHPLDNIIEDSIVKEVQEAWDTFYTRVLFTPCIAEEFINFMASENENIKVGKITYAEDPDIVY